MPSTYITHNATECHHWSHKRLLIVFSTCAVALAKTYTHILMCIIGGLNL